MNATRKFMKDLVVAGIGFGIMVLFLSAGSGVNGSADLFGCFMCSGVLFGWKYVNKVFMALSWWALLIKALAAVVVGIFAMPMVRSGVNPVYVSALMGHSGIEITT